VDAEGDGQRIECLAAAFNASSADRYQRPLVLAPHEQRQRQAGLADRPLGSAEINSIFPATPATVRQVSPQRDGVSRRRSDPSAAGEDVRSCHVELGNSDMNTALDGTGVGRWFSVTVAVSAIVLKLVRRRAASMRRQRGRPQVPLRSQLRDPRSLDANQGESAPSLNPYAFA
jgi:hypothetical protein